MTPMRHAVGIGRHRPGGTYPAYGHGQRQPTVPGWICTISQRLNGATDA
jgi:hypothetical protein